MSDTATYDLYLVVASEDGIGAPKVVYQMSTLEGTLAGASDFQRIPPGGGMPFNQSALQGCLDKTGGDETFSQIETAWENAWEKLSDGAVSNIPSLTCAYARHQDGPLGKKVLASFPERFGRQAEELYNWVYSEYQSGRDGTYDTGYSQNTSELHPQMPAVMLATLLHSRMEKNRKILRALSSNTTIIKGYLESYAEGSDAQSRSQLKHIADESETIKKEFTALRVPKLADSSHPLEMAVQLLGSSQGQKWENIDDNLVRLSQQLEVGSLDKVVKDSMAELSTASDLASALTDWDEHQRSVLTRYLESLPSSSQPKGKKKGKSKKRGVPACEARGPNPNILFQTTASTGLCGPRSGPSCRCTGCPPKGSQGVSGAVWRGSKYRTGWNRLA